MVAAQKATAAGKHKAAPGKKPSVKSEPKQQKTEKSSPVPKPVKANEAQPMLTEEYFPRGGASALTPLEYRQVTDQAKKDILFEQTTPATDERPVKSKRKRRRAEDDASSKEQDGTNKKRKEETTIAEQISFKRLTVGMSVLGCIKEINDLDMVIALPHQLNGYVSITDISDVISAQVEKAAADDESDAASNDDAEDTSIPDLNDFFSIGQVVSCAISALEDTTGSTEDSDKGRRRVVLSLKPQQVNAGLSADDLVEGSLLPVTVASEEDHGYILSTGIEGVSGFLLKKNALKYITERNNGRPLKEGQWLQCAVLKLDEARKTATYTLDPDHIAKAVIPNSQAIGFGNLKAGALVNAKVKKILENGIQLGFLGVLEGTVDIFHVGIAVKDAEADLKEHFTVGQKLQARVVSVNATRKKIILSLLPHLLEAKPFTFPATTDVDVGTIVEDFVVARVDSGTGLYLEHQVYGYGYVHISRLTDGKIDKIEKKFKIGSKQKGRVLAFDYCDGLLQVTFQPSVLAQQFIRHDDIKPGMKVSGQIVKVDSYGVLVTLTSTIKALCPSTHLADVKLTNPEKKFKVGGTLKAQVLSVDPKNKRVVLTSKKSLVNSELPRITSYLEAQVGQVSHGVITAVKDFGCLVTFYGNVKALAPLAELTESFVQHPSDLFSIGQVIKCRVISVDPAEEKMRVSFKTRGFEGAGSVDSVQIGELVEGRVISVVADKVLVELKPSLVRGFLEKAHISDHPSVAETLFSGLRDGLELKNMVVIEKDMRRNHVKVSMKGILVEEAKSTEGPRTFADFKTGMVFPGFVRNIREKNCYIGGIGDFTAVAHIQNISDRYVTNIEDFIKAGQSVVACVTGLNNERRWLEVSLKHSDCVTPETAKRYETVLLQSLFREQDLMQAWKLGKRKASLKGLADRIHIGAVVNGTVKSIMPYGAIVDLSEGVSGLITTTESAQLKVGDQVTGRVVDVNAGKQIVDMLLLSNGSKKTENTNAELIKKVVSAQKQATEVEGVVQLVKEDYAILTLPKYHDAVAYAFAKNFNSAVSAFTKYRVGQKVRAIITDIPTVETKKASCYANQRIVVVPKAPTVKQENLTVQQDIKDPVDPKFKKLSDYTPGAMVQGTIISINDDQINVRLGANLMGRVHITQVADKFEELSDPRHPLDKYQKSKGSMTFKVWGFHDAKTHKFLPFSHRKPTTQTMVELTLRPSEMSLPDNALTTSDKEPTSLENIVVGSEHLGFIHSVVEDAIWVHVAPGLLGRAHLLEASNDIKVLRQPLKHLTPGLAVRCWVSDKNTDEGLLNLTMKGRESRIDWNTAKQGQRTLGRIQRVQPDKGILVQVAPKLSGFVHLTDVSDKYTKNPTSGFRPDQIVECCIINVNKEKNQLDLSLRQSRVNPTKTEETTMNPEIHGFADIKPDSVVSGYIKNVSDNGCFVALNRSINARVKIAELSDAFIKEWKEAFKVGQLVTGRILSVNANRNQIEMSLKQSVVDPSPEDAQRITWDTLEAGQKVKGSVKRVAEFGVFVQLANSSITGLCHKSELSDKPVNMIEKLYAVGDAVKAVVLRVKKDEKKLSLGLKASYFDEADLIEDEEASEHSMDVDADQNGAQGDGMEVDTDVEDSDDDSEAEDGEDYADEDGDVMEVDGDGESDAVSESDMEDAEAEDFDTADHLDIGGFKWDGAEDDLEEEGTESDGSDEEEIEADGKSKKKSRRAKQRAKREEEERIAQKEQELLEGDKPPEVAEDFERLLLGSPNSSFLWIKFMAFQLQMAEVEKARLVAERAISTINYREEQEKMNLWVAYMNLENTYGTQESLLKVFERAIAMNNPKATYFHLVRIYERTEKWDQAEQLYQVMTKRFKESSKVWTNFGLFCLRRRKVDDARKLLQRSLQSLAKRKHVKTICKFAQMEFKYGEPERGRTIFEGIMSNYPKRVDLWSIYLDMEIKCGDAAITRRLFERVIRLKFSSKKMKFFFKKYLDFEKKHGTDATVEHVKAQAIAYVERIQNE
ncbi:hypothetical protein HDU85_007438 [Gaertneriomyces sp. JEL0708]|nr:hypothetical protein HDU85_007438 [Gaertneriomyces sp. JEL0708]